MALTGFIPELLLFFRKRRPNPKSVHNIALVALIVRYFPVENNCRIVSNCCPLSNCDPSFFNQEIRHDMLQIDIFVI